MYLSFDFELAWGVIANGRWRHREKAGVYDRLFKMFPALLGALESREVAVDWATVGALLVEPGEVPHEHLPEDYGRALRAFVAEAAETSKDGRRLIDLLLACRHQRLLSHSMTHVVLDRDDVTAECAVADLTAAGDRLRAAGHGADVLVLPENRECPEAVLVAAGVRAIRTPARYDSDRVRRTAQKLHDLPAAEVSGGAVRRLSGSLLFQPRGVRWRDRAVFRLQRAGVVAAARRGRDLCLWLHPFNFGVYPDLMDDLVVLLDELCTLRDADRLRFASLVDVR